MNDFGLILSILLISCPGKKAQYCTGEFTCDQTDLYDQESGVHSNLTCQQMCSNDSNRCTAYTYWTSTSLYHWNQCWLFSDCSPVQCQDCQSGTTGDCLTTTPATTVDGAGCPPLTEDQFSSMTCFPDVTMGEAVENGTHCIWQCGDDSSLHTCAGGGWDVNPPSGCYCPALPDSNGGQFVCVPPLMETGEAVDDTFCIMTCDGLPTMELQCSSGSWDNNLDDIKCP